MGWFILMSIFSVLLSLVRTRNLSDQEKDLEILILRKQLTILQRKLDKPIRPNRTDKLILSVLTKRLKILSNQSTAQLYLYSYLPTQYCHALAPSTCSS